VPVPVLLPIVPAPLPLALLPPVCAMDKPPIASAATAATVVRVFLMVVIL